MKITDELLRRFKSWPTFTALDAYRHIKKVSRSATRTSVQVTLFRLVRDGRLYRVAKGVFSLRDNAEYTGFAFSPFYYGGLSALMIRDLIDDQVKLEIMTTKTVRKSHMALFDGSVEVILHHVSSARYFGFDMIAYGGIEVPVSNPEKTLIDLFYYGIRLPIQDYSELLRVVSREKVRGYLKVYDKHTATVVLNFIKKYKGPADSGRLRNPY
jgi:predicted transcriptional regulator of viral defense system